MSDSLAPSESFRNLIDIASLNPGMACLIF